MSSFEDNHVKKLKRDGKQKKKQKKTVLIRESQTNKQGLILL